MLIIYTEEKQLSTMIKKLQLQLRKGHKIKYETIDQKNLNGYRKMIRALLCSFGLHNLYLKTQNKY